jgi:hypothetical protein
MSLKPPVFPKALTYAKWKEDAKKEKIAEIGDIEDAIENLERAYKKIKWDVSVPDPGTLPKVLKTLTVAVDKQPALKGKSAAKTLKSAATKFLEELEEFLANAKKADAAEKAEAAADADADADEEAVEGYNLKLQLKRARTRDPKFAFVKSKSKLNPKIRYQVFLDKKKLNKARIGKEFGEEYPAFKLLAIGIVTYNDKVFTFASKQPPKDAWQKLLTKSFKVQKCLALGEVAFRPLTEADDPELFDEATSETDIDEIDAADLAADLAAEFADDAPSEKHPDVAADRSAHPDVVAQKNYKSRRETVQNLHDRSAPLPQLKDRLRQKLQAAAQLAESGKYKDATNALPTDAAIKEIEEALKKNAESTKRKNASSATPPPPSSPSPSPAGKGVPDATNAKPTTPPKSPDAETPPPPAKDKPAGSPEVQNDLEEVAAEYRKYMNIVGEIKRNAKTLIDKYEGEFQMYAEYAGENFPDRDSLLNKVAEVHAGKILLKPITQGIERLEKVRKEIQSKINLVRYVEQSGVFEDKKKKGGEERTKYFNEIKQKHEEFLAKRQKLQLEVLLLHFELKKSLEKGNESVDGITDSYERHRNAHFFVEDPIDTNSTGHKEFFTDAMKTLDARLEEIQRFRKLKNDGKEVTSTTVLIEEIKQVKVKLGLVSDRSVLRKSFERDLDGFFEIQNLEKKTEETADFSSRFAQLKEATDNLLVAWNDFVAQSARHTTEVVAFLAKITDVETNTKFRTEWMKILTDAQEKVNEAKDTGTINGCGGVLGRAADKFLEENLPKLKQAQKENEELQKSYLAEVAEMGEQKGKNIKDANYSKRCAEALLRAEVYVESGDYKKALSILREIAAPSQAEVAKAPPPLKPIQDAESGDKQETKTFATLDFKVAPVPQTETKATTPVSVEKDGKAKALALLEELDFEEAAKYEEKDESEIEERVEALKKEREDAAFFLPDEIGKFKKQKGNILGHLKGNKFEAMGGEESEVGKDLDLIIAPCDDNNLLDKQFEIIRKTVETKMKVVLRSVKELCKTADEHGKTIVEYCGEDGVFDGMDKKYKETLEKIKKESKTIKEAEEKIKKDSVELKGAYLKRTTAIANAKKVVEIYTELRRDLKTLMLNEAFKNSAYLKDFSERVANLSEKSFWNLFSNEEGLVAELVKTRGGEGKALLDAVVALQAELAKIIAAPAEGLSLAETGFAKAKVENERFKEIWKKTLETFKNFFLENAKAAIKKEEGDKSLLKTIENMQAEAEKLAASGSYRAALDSLDSARQYATFVENNPGGLEVHSRKALRTDAKKFTSALDGFSNEIEAVAEDLRGASKDTHLSGPTKEAAGKAVKKLSALRTLLNQNEIRNAFEVPVDKLLDTKKKDHVGLRKWREEGLARVQTIKNVLEKHPLIKYLSTTPFGSVSSFTTALRALTQRVNLLEGNFLTCC